MTEYKVDCPRCQTALKSPKPIPAGMKVKCPRCNNLFSTPGVAAPVLATVAASPAAAAPVAVAPAAIKAAPPLPTAVPVANGSPALAAGPPPAQAMFPAQTYPGLNGAHAVPAAAPGKGKTIAIIVGGAVGLLLLVLLLVLLCFGGDKRNPTPTQVAGDIEEGFEAPVRKQKPRPLIELPPEEQKKVDAAIQLGTGYLRKMQQPNGSWPGTPHPVGYAAIAGLTLLETGTKADDPVIVKAAKFVRDAMPRLNGTYEISLAILFLNKLAGPGDKQRIQELTLRLVAAQNPQGGWSYICPILTKADHDQLYAILKDLKDNEAQEVVRRLDAKGKGGGVMNLPPSIRNLAVLRPDQNQPDQFFRGGGDNSNTQFAILALWAARSHDVPLDKTLKLLNRRFRATQNPDGRWTYNGQGEVTHLPTMTCAGLLGMAVGFGLEQKGKGGRAADDPQVKKGLEYMSRFIGDPGKQQGKPPMQQMYFMWSAERVGVLYQLKTINTKKWYEWGVEVLTHKSFTLTDQSLAALRAEKVPEEVIKKLQVLRGQPPRAQEDFVKELAKVLDKREQEPYQKLVELVLKHTGVGNQHPDGWWQGGGHGSTQVLDTCFAILFLHRVNLAKDLTDKLNEQAAAPAAGAPGRPPARKD